MRMNESDIASLSESEILSRIDKNNKSILLYRKISLIGCCDQCKKENRDLNFRLEQLRIANITNGPNPTSPT